MANSDELLISRSSTFRSLRAFAASSFMSSRALLPSTGFVGLDGTGDWRPDGGGKDGEVAKVTLPGSDLLLAIRFSLCSGLGVMAEWSIEGARFRSVTESMDERLELLACPILMTDVAALDLLRARSGTSGVLDPVKIESAEFWVFKAGRMT